MAQEIASVLQAVPCQSFQAHGKTNAGAMAGHYSDQDNQDNRSRSSSIMQSFNDAFKDIRDLSKIAWPSPLETQSSTADTQQLACQGSAAGLLDQVSQLQAELAQQRETRQERHALL